VLGSTNGVGTVAEWLATVISPTGAEALRRHDAWVRREGKRTQALPFMVRGLWKREPIASRVKQFREETWKDGHDLWRVQMAIQRALEPLDAGECGESQGIELSVAELDDAGRLQDFLEASFGRERILLERLPDSARAQRLKHGPPR
jgi:hypothetical protein